MPKGSITQVRMTYTKDKGPKKQISTPDYGHLPIPLEHQKATHGMLQD